MTAGRDETIDRCPAERGGVVRGRDRRAVAVAFFTTGAAALVLQITWQRIIALHAGADLSSATTVVAAFLGGLGLGNLLGGRLADRLRPDRALVALAVTNVGIAGFALSSPWLLYDLYRRWAPDLESTLATFLFNAAVLVVPTTLMGMSLPLVARAVTGVIGDAGAVVGRFHAANTIGGAVGALVAAWYVVGTYGFVATIRIAAVSEMMAAVVLVTVALDPRWGGARGRRLRHVVLVAGITLTLASICWSQLAAAGPVLPWSPLAGVVVVLIGSGLVAVCLVRIALPERFPGLFARLHPLVLGGIGAALGLSALAWYLLVRADTGLPWHGSVGGLILAGGILCLGLTPLLGQSKREINDDGATSSPGAAHSPITADESAVALSVSSHGEPAATMSSALAWCALYAVTGAVALGFELVFFRLIDGVMRSNSYTFGHVLALYLAFFAAGTAAGSYLVPRARDWRRWFLWLQFGVGLSAVTSLVIFLDVLPALGLRRDFDVWFASDGFANGQPSSGDFFLFGVVAPLFLMAGPVLLMGMAFPFVQALVNRDLRRLGRNTGGVVFANLAGNVVGAVVTSFVLIDRLGIGGTYVVLCAPLLAAGIAAASFSPSRRIGVIEGAAAAVVLLAAVVALPTNTELWSVLNGRPPGIIVAEDRSCASVLKVFRPSGSQLTLNGASQNGHPFDDFHVLIGLVPALVHPDPQRAAAIGFGAGSTSFALLASDRLESMTSVELCAGTFDIAREMARRGEPDFVRVTTDPVHHEVTGDGRKYLQTHDGTFDLIVSDHNRITSASAGNLFSREFYELMRSRLRPGGIATSWIPTYRVQNAIMTTFPHAVALAVESYGGSRFFLGSRSPIDISPKMLVQRYDRISGAFREPQRSTIRQFLTELTPMCLTDGHVVDASDAAENRDLHPRDEYFLDNGGASEDKARPAC